MRRLQDMSVRELVIQLALLDNAIRQARTRESVPASSTSGAARTACEELARLTTRQQQIVLELRRRRSVDTT